jgi:hypothetical protein
MRRIVAAILLGATAVGCGTTGEPLVRAPAFAAGTPAVPFRVGEWTVTLEVARVGLGPLYFCAEEEAPPDVCPEVAAEIAASAALDALDSTPQALGEVLGLPSEITLVALDFGVSWFAWQEAPAPTRGAPGGHSARFEGRAVRGATTIRFAADVDVPPPERGARALVAPAGADLAGSGLRLDVRIDPHAWWSGVDFDALAQGGADPVVVAPGSQAYEAVVEGMTSAAPPTFSWSRR